MLDLQNQCVEELCILYSSKTKFTVLNYRYNLQNLHEEKCYARFSNKTELWPFTCPWTSESVCGRILSTILLWAKIWPLPVLNLQNSHEEICYAWFSNKLNLDPSPVLDPQDLCVEVLYVLEAVEVSDGEHEQEPVPLPHILLPHRAELLLTCRVQYYKQGEKVGQYNRTKK